MALTTCAPGCAPNDAGDLPELPAPVSDPLIGPDYEIVQFCDLGDPALAPPVPFFRVFTFSRDALGALVTEISDIAADGTPYVVQGEVGQCASGSDCVCEWGSVEW